jgi:centromeric protein E
MLGEQTEPGLVPLALQHLFDLIDSSQDRYFLLKLSMLEIYNEVRLSLYDG